MRPLRALRLSVLVLCLGGVAAATSAAAAGPPREPFFPAAGNPGIDVLHYGASFSFTPATGTIRADTVVTIAATRRLPRFSLDLDGLRVTAVEVDRESARFSRERGKLWIRPPAAIAAGERFYVTVFYRGRPRTVVDPDGTKEGWLRTDDGAVALGEPKGTPAWLPCDNVPADKATFDVTVVVPRPLVAVSNGRLRGPESLGPRRRFSWHEERPMSTYLALVDIGRGRLARSTIAGLPSWTLVDPRLAKGSRAMLAELPQVIRFESRLYGDYPFEAAGSVVDYVPDVGYALENQTRPFYPYVPDLTTVVHETAHQWFGDSVGLKRWPNIWLNEGFATWTEWYYAECHGGRSARAIFTRLYRVPASDESVWKPPPGHPGSPKRMFGPSVYIRGAMALEALRLKIGTKPMLRLLREWEAGHRYGSADIAEFTSLAEEISGQDLHPFFQRWLYKPGKP
jgi:aminopeptidase N